MVDNGISPYPVAQGAVGNGLVLNNARLRYEIVVKLIKERDPFFGGKLQNNGGIEALLKVLQDSRLPNKPGAQSWKRPDGKGVFYLTGTLPYEHIDGNQCVSDASILLWGANERENLRVTITPEDTIRTNEGKFPPDRMPVESRMDLQFYCPLPDDYKSKGLNPRDFAVGFVTHREGKKDQIFRYYSAALRISNLLGARLIYFPENSDEVKEYLSLASKSSLSSKGKGGIVLSVANTSPEGINELIANISAGKALPAGYDIASVVAAINSGQTAMQNPAQSGAISAILTKPQLTWAEAMKDFKKQYTFFGQRIDRAVKSATSGSAIETMLNGEIYRVLRYKKKFTRGVLAGEWTLEIIVQYRPDMSDEHLTIYSRASKDEIEKNNAQNREIVLTMVVDYGGKAHKQNTSAQANGKAIAVIMRIPGQREFNKDDLMHQIIEESLYVVAQDLGADPSRAGVGTVINKLRQTK